MFFARILTAHLRGSVSHEAPTAPTYNNPGDLDLDDDLPYLTSDQAEEKMEQTGRAVHYIDAHTHNPSCVYPAFERDDDTMEHPGMGELGGHPNDDPDEDEDD